MDNTQKNTNIYINFFTKHFISLITATAFGIGSLFFIFYFLFIGYIPTFDLSSVIYILIVISIIGFILLIALFFSFIMPGTLYYWWYTRVKDKSKFSGFILIIFGLLSLVAAYYSINMLVFSKNSDILFMFMTIIISIITNISIGYTARKEKESILLAIIGSLLLFFTIFFINHDTLTTYIMKELKIGNFPVKNIIAKEPTCQIAQINTNTTTLENNSLCNIGEGNILWHIGKYTYIEFSNQNQIIVPSESILGYSFTSQKIQTLSSKNKETKKNIIFDFDSVEFSNKGDAIINKLAKKMIEDKTKKLVLSSFSSIEGTKEYNKKLAKDRFKVVYNKLIKLGISKDRILSNIRGAEGNLNQTVKQKDTLNNSRKIEYYFINT